MHGPADRDATAILAATDRTRVPELVPVRYERMLTSPFAFLRGAAAVMAEDLRHQPIAGIPVQACGDCHLMNFGAFATPEQNILFDINDFDETLPGVDFTADLKRLVGERRGRSFGGQSLEKAGAGDRGDHGRGVSSSDAQLGKAFAPGNLAQQGRARARDRAHRGSRAPTRAAAHPRQGARPSRGGRQLPPSGKGQAGAHRGPTAAHLSFHGQGRRPPPRRRQARVQRL